MKKKFLLSLLSLLVFSATTLFAQNTGNGGQADEDSYGKLTDLGYNPHTGEYNLSIWNKQSCEIEFEVKFWLSPVKFETAKVPANTTKNFTFKYPQGASKVAIKPNKKCGENGNGNGNLGWLELETLIVLPPTGADGCPMVSYENVVQAIPTMDINKNTMIVDYSDITIQNFNWNGGDLVIDGFVYTTSNINPNGKRISITKNSTLKGQYSALNSSDTIILEEGATFEIYGLTNANGDLGNKKYPIFYLAKNAKVKINGEIYTQVGIYQVGQNPNNSIKISTCDTDLPVTFGPISASTANGKVMINFTTESEMNNDHFELLASKDGSNFTKIAEVKSKAENGNSSNRINYQVEIPFSSMALGASVIALLGFGLIPNKKARILASSILILSIFTMYSCSKNSDSISTDIETGYKFIKVVQVDKDGTSKESKVISIVKN